jgi:hypothetical protein
MGDLRSLAARAACLGLIAAGSASQTAPVSFAPQASYSLGPTLPLPTGVVMTDVSGDGIVDVIVAESDMAKVAVLLGVGGGALAPVVHYGVSVSAHSVALGDLNHDGHLDLVVSGFAVAVRLGQGGGVFGPSNTYSGGPLTEGVALGDLDEDGHLDAVVANASVGTVSLLRGDGAGALGTPEPYTTGGGNPESVAIGDLDGDGHLDVANTNRTTHDISILLGQGDGSFSAAATYSGGAGTRPRCVIMADLNGDARLDLAAANENTHRVSVFLGLGDGTVGNVTNYPVGMSPFSVAAGDLNGDGKPDLAAACSGSDTVSVLLGAEHGAFGPVQHFAVQQWPRSVAMGDLDADGKLDLGVGNYASSSLSVLRNESPWLELGFGLAGLNGVPALAGTGTLATGSTGGLSLGGAAPAAFAMLFISLSGNAAPFKCGTLVPAPVAFQLPLVTGSGGAIPLAWTSWPAGLAGLSLYFQYAIQDAAAACGVALSNAVRADVP